MFNSLLGLLSSLGSSGASSLLLLGELRENLLIALSGLLGLGPAGLGLPPDDVLAAEALLRDHTLDLGALVDGLVTTLDLTLDNIAGAIILLAVKSEGLDDVATALGAETVGAVDVGDTFDFLLTLLDDAEEDSGQVRADNAATHGLALAVTITAGFITRTTGLEENARAVVEQDTLLHLETLLVVTTSDSENVTLVGIVIHHFAGDFLSDTSVVEGTDEFFIINFNFLLSASGGVRNVELHL